MRPQGYFEASGTAAASGNGTILAAPSTTQAHYIYEFQVQTEGTGPQTYILTGGSVARRIYTASAGDGLLGVGATAHQDRAIWQLQPGSALVINSSGSALYNYYVRGYTDQVY